MSRPLGSGDRVRHVTREEWVEGHFASLWTWGRRAQEFAGREFTVSSRHAVSGLLSLIGEPGRYHPTRFELVTPQEGAVMADKENPFKVGDHVVHITREQYDRIGTPLFSWDNFARNCENERDVGVIRTITRIHNDDYVDLAGVLYHHSRFELAETVESVERTFTESQIVRAVMGYRLGCPDGKREFLREELGIRAQATKEIEVSFKVTFDPWAGLDIDEFVNELEAAVDQGIREYPWTEEVDCSHSSDFTYEELG